MGGTYDDDEEEVPNFLAVPDDDYEDDLPAIMRDSKHREDEEEEQPVMFGEPLAKVSKHSNEFSDEFSMEKKLSWNMPAEVEE